MKNKVIFLDRDGTINKDFGYVHEINKLEFLPNVLTALKSLQQNGYKLIIITNQSGIGRKYFTVDDYNKFNSYMLNKMKQNGVLIDKVYYCPHTDSDNCDCRKPKTKLFEQAIDEYNVDLYNSYAIGDNDRDLAICDITPINGIILGKKSKKYVQKRDLYEASNYILKNK